MFEMETLAKTYYVTCQQRATGRRAHCGVQVQDGCGAAHECVVDSYPFY